MRHCWAAVGPFDLAQRKRPSLHVRKHKIKGGGQECPPHTASGK